MADYVNPIEPPQEVVSQEFSLGDDDNKADVNISDALEQMTLEEREKITFEAYGIATEVEEDDEMVDRCLSEMETWVQKLINKRSIPSEAYKIAVSKSPEFCHDKKFRLKFLRADEFDSKKAADRFIRYFDLKKFLFGEDKLVRKITMKDFDKEDKAALKSGVFQALPKRDSAGRIVTFVFPSELHALQPKNLVREKQKYLQLQLHAAFPILTVFLPLLGPSFLVLSRTRGPR